MIKARDRDGGQRLRFRRQLAFWGATAIGIGCVVAVLWSALRPGRVHAEVAPEQARLEGIAEKKRAETKAAANRLRQHQVGEGYRFDENGNVVGAPANGDELMPNKSLNEVAGN